MSEIAEIHVTLCFICEPTRILLGFKKRGFAAGKWNGYGGKIEPGETVEQAAKREMFEESGVNIIEMEPAGFVHFTMGGRDFNLNMHIFRVTKHEGEPLETEEMCPQWFNLDEIPYDKMWSDDPFWLPLFLKKQNFKAKFVMDANDGVVSHEIEIIQ